MRTDSHGNVYVFGVGIRNGSTVQMMYRSSDGGAHWSGPVVVARAVAPGVIEPVLGRPVMDGIAGARVDPAVGPSVDIANGAPTGTPATDEVFMTWADGRAGLNHERLLLIWSRDGGSTWSSPTVVPTQTGDRPFYSAPAAAPDGSDLYVVDNAFTTPYRNDTSSVRGLVGQVWHAEVTAGTPSGWTSLQRGAVGDPRGSAQNDLTAEFLGDYVYAAATNDDVVAVWNDVRAADDCSTVDAYRASLYAASPSPAPNVPASCPATFGNSDIFGGRRADPTP